MTTQTLEHCRKVLTAINSGEYKTAIEHGAVFDDIKGPCVTMVLETFDFMSMSVLPQAYYESLGTEAAHAQMLDKALRNAKRNLTQHIKKLEAE